MTPKLHPYTCEGSKTETNPRGPSLGRTYISLGSSQLSFIEQMLNLITNRDVLTSTSLLQKINRRDLHQFRTINHLS